MVFGLAKRELRGRYKGSVLGFLWTFLNPLLQLLVYTLLFGVLLKSSINDFYLYLFVGLIPWLFIQNALQNGSTAILNQKSLVTKIRFPREVLPIAHVTTGFINMLYCFVVIFLTVGTSLLIRSWGTGQIISPDSEVGLYNFLPWIVLPLVMIIQYIFALGLCFLSSSITVYIRDLEHILGVFTMLWCYCTPIMYDARLILGPEGYAKYGWVFEYLNPMTGIVRAYQDILYRGTWPNFKLLLVSFGYAILFLVVGFLVFEKLKRRFAEEI